MNYEFRPASLEDCRRFEPRERIAAVWREFWAGPEAEERFMAMRPWVVDAGDRIAAVFGTGTVEVPPFQLPWVWAAIAPPPVASARLVLATRKDVVRWLELFADGHYTIPEENTETYRRFLLVYGFEEDEVLGLWRWRSSRLR